MRPTWTQEDLRHRERELRSATERRRRLRERRRGADGPASSTRNPEPEQK